ncbi:hypothetical protein D3C76_1565410 [compost metagenome]
MAMNPATMADGEVSAKGRSWVCVASFMTAVFLYTYEDVRCNTEPLWERACSRMRSVSYINVC